MNSTVLEIKHGTAADSEAWHMVDYRRYARSESRHVCSV